MIFNENNSNKLSITDNLSSLHRIKNDIRELYSQPLICHGIESKISNVFHFIKEMKIVLLVQLKEKSINKELDFAIIFNYDFPYDFPLIYEFKSNRSQHGIYLGDSKGLVCLSFLFKSKWKPNETINSIIFSLSLILSNKIKRMKAEQSKVDFNDINKKDITCSIHPESSYFDKYLNNIGFLDSIESLNIDILFYSYNSIINKYVEVIDLDANKIRLVEEYSYDNINYNSEVIYEIIFRKQYNKCFRNSFSIINDMSKMVIDEMVNLANNTSKKKRLWSELERRSVENEMINKEFAIKKKMTSLPSY